MGRKIRLSWRVLIPLSALVLLLASVPAIGSHVDTVATLTLHLDSHGRYFEYSVGSVTQTIPVPERCEVSITGTLASITQTGDRSVGLVSNSIGVKSGGAQGTACSRVDTTENLTISLGDVPLASHADLDLELKGGAKVRIQTYLGSDLVGDYEIRSGSSIVVDEGLDGSPGAPFTASVTDEEPIANCKNASDSGPDSGLNDNCRVTVHGDSLFDSVKFTVLVGEFSLEGGGDTPAETIFYLSEFEGLLGCTTANNTVAFAEYSVVGTITRLNNTDGSTCVLKLYNIDVDENNVLTFIPDPTDTQQAAYQAVVNFGPKNGTNPFSSQLEYDQDDDGPMPFEFMPWCEDDPFDSPSVTGSIDTSVIPTGHTWCIVSAETSVVDDDNDGTDTVSTTWTVVGVGDPKLR